MAIADAMASNGMKTNTSTWMVKSHLHALYIAIHVYTYIDCWADKRCEDGSILPDVKQFPK